jgi:hypothetical protein
MTPNEPKPPADATSNLIDFEPVTVAQARQALNDLPAAIEAMFDSIPGGWEAFRAQQTREDKRMGKHAMIWLTQLSKELRPMGTAVQFPHIINRLAGYWNKPAELEAYFESLLNSKRQNRKGFPENVNAELEALHKFSLG